MERRGITTLKAGDFHGLSNLNGLDMQHNQLTTLPAGLFADLTSIETLLLDYAVDPRLCERPQDEQDDILDRFPDISDCWSLTATSIRCLCRISYLSWLTIWATEIWVHTVRSLSRRRSWTLWRRKTATVFPWCQHSLARVNSPSTNTFIGIGSGVRI